MKLQPVTVHLPGIPDATSTMTLDYVFPDTWPTIAPFTTFRERAIDALGKRWMPVYRMADGEFAFAVGPHGKSWRAKARRARFIAQRTARRGLAIRTMWKEAYSHCERIAVMPQFKNELRDIAQNGAFALFFKADDEFESREYVAPLQRFFAECHARIDASSIIPFHYPLTLLTGRDNEVFYRGRHIGVVSSMTEQKRSAITSTLMALGARAVSCVSLPVGAPLLTRPTIDFDGKPDIIFVGAGIGASAVLTSLRRYETLTLDVGGYIEALATPNDFQPHLMFRVPNIGSSAKSA